MAGEGLPIPKNEDKGISAGESYVEDKPADFPYFNLNTGIYGKNIHPIGLMYGNFPFMLLFDDTDIMTTKDSLALRYVKRSLKNRLHHDGYYLKWMIAIFAIAVTKWTLRLFTEMTLLNLICDTMLLCVAAVLVSQYFMCKGFVELQKEDEQKQISNKSSEPT